jgi:hypothetical protein
MSIAFATVAPASVCNMAEDTQQWRRRRLGELADAIGGNAFLGRKLGYKDGQFVSQMRRGARAITEKTVEAAEKITDSHLPGRSARGWFDRVGRPVQRDLLETVVAAVPNTTEADGDVPTTAKSLIAQVAFVMESMDEQGRRLAIDAFAVLAGDPQSRTRAEFMLAGAMASEVKPPPPSSPKPKTKRKTSAAPARKAAPPKLEVKPGGGQQSLIERMGIKPLQQVILDDYAGRDEQKLYKTFASYPKASDKEQ